MLLLLCHNHSFGNHPHLLYHRLEIHFLLHPNRKNFMKKEKIQKEQKESIAILPGSESLQS